MNNALEKTSELETLETLFYVAMKAHPNLFVIAEEYNISGQTFGCDVHVDGNSFETCLSTLYDKVKNKHQETIKIKRFFEENLKQTVNSPVQYIKGYVVYNGVMVYSFSVFSPREKVKFEWVKSGFRSQKQVEVKLEKQQYEFETHDTYYQYSVDANSLEEEELQKAKLHIVKAIHRKISLSEETLVYQNFERVWTEMKQKGEVEVDAFEKFLTDVFKFKELSSPEAKPLAEELYASILSYKAVMNQYELARKYEPERMIYFS